MSRRVGHFSPTALRSAMTRRNLTVDDLAVHLEASTGTIHGWLSSRRSPEPPLLLQLSEALGVRPADLTLVDEGQERLADLRIHAGLLQADAAHCAGIAQPQLSKMERGVTAPRSELIDALASTYALPAARVENAWARSRDDRRRHAETKTR